MAYILIVEDDKDVAGVFCQAFRAERHRCFVLRSEEMAIKFLRKAVPDLVVSDYLLKGGSGIEVARAASVLNIPAIVTSGDHTKEKEIGEAGFVFLKKPFRLSTLMRAASALLDTPARDNNSGHQRAPRISARPL
jgi:DNA-binding response OmpR family regulator